ncbi:MAG: MFS transporter [Deltaproteobacteria bacterium]|nr:MFS transporter [Deltaproteobacteria bacterium]
MSARSRLPATVIALGLVSLLTDAASEMIMPLLPIFLTTVVGAGAAFVGLVVGVADTTAAFVKLASGAAVDRAPAKKPFVVLGYTLASAVRPLIALATAPWHVLAVRFTDRIGKGLRSSPRDALLAGAADEDQRGRAFGFHRAMDHAGAVVGPLAALVLLRVAGVPLRTVFALAAIPGALAVAVVVLGVHETRAPAKAALAPPKRLSERLGLRGAPLSPRFRRYLFAVALFTLASSTDTFLILKALQVGMAPWLAPVLWAALHLVRAAMSTWAGGLSDRMGRASVIRIGWVIYGVSYAAFAFASTELQVWLLVAIYGGASAFHEGAEKALVADLAPADAKGRAFGLFHFTVGLCALPASLGFGALWQFASARAAFLTSGGLALAAALLLGWALRPDAVA